MRTAARAGRRSVRAAKVCLITAFGIAAVAICVIAGFYLKLAAGPLNLRGYSAELESSLAERLGPGWRVSVSDTWLELLGSKPAIRTTGLEIRNSLGVTVVRAPYAIVSLNPLSLLFGEFSPREIELRDLHLRGVIAQDGSLSFATPIDTPPVAAPALPAGDGSGTVPPTPSVSDQKAPSTVSAAASSLIRPLVAPSGVIGALDRATLVDARLSLVGADGRERAAFDGVDAVFERVAGGDRRFEIDLRGQRGAWRVAGRVSGGKGHAASLEAHGVPVADLMLLTGLSNAPITSDIKLSGSLSASFGRDRLAHLDAKLAGSPGSIARSGMLPLRFDTASAEFAWDEQGRTLAISDLRIRSEGTHIDLHGKLADEPQEGWKLVFGGRDAVIADIDPARPAFRLDTVEGEARFDEGRAALSRLAMRGDDVDVTVSGAYAPGSTGEVLGSQIDVRASDARRVVRLWPDFLNPELRSYLAQRVGGGRVDSLRMRSSLDAADFKAAFSDQPVTDRSMEIDFSTSDITLNVVDGLPPLRKLAVLGRTTGTTATLSATGGAIEMPDGRRLGFSNASYVHSSLGTPGTAGKVGFRVRGGLDALASFMRSPLIREAGAPDFDPATVRGTVDLRATLPLVPGAIPPLAQLGIEVTGSLADVAVDKLPGRERMEGGNFAVQQEGGGALTLKGEAKLGGSPATIDLRVPKTGTGELLITATLDEAARARRSLPVAPALAGPVGLKITVPLGGKSVPRVEADLARATIDGLVPGWQKPPNRPGRIGFTINDGTSTELRDFVVDSGSTQIKGQLVLSAAGALEKADMASVRLSPGDDMRVQLDRSGTGYRVAVRGNNVDARPFLKWLNAPPAKGGKDANHETEVDLNVAILTGFNDEAMTGVTAKLSAKGGELRGLQFGGKFRSAAVEATLAKRDAGAPILSVRTGDAGATLRFLDLYRRMTGGRLALEARTNEGVQQGHITIEEFGLRGEPALRRIVAQSQQGASGTDERGAAPVSRQDIDQVLFTRLTTGFRRAGSRMDYTDAVIYGPQVGFNLSGWVDTVRDRLDVNGTFVPAYLLNNAFSQLPVVGLILGGGRTEGLIAVDFRVVGPLSGPTVTVNPLTAVAPGILRKLFGWMMPEGQVPPGQATAPVEPSPAPRRGQR